ncbi:MAG: DUF2652 domain-containing protein [Rhodothermales bacterium]
MSTATHSAQPTLLFIPDISGFTQFVHETEISHSQHIIEELLEILIDANEIGLEVSEIEGDAVLFYRDGPPPTAAELLAQVQRMYVRFHAHLKMYDAHRICRCGACNSASGLSLKFIVHFGETGKNKIKEHSKLFGKDVIVAHRLMKNEIAHTEYVLFTQDLVSSCSSWVHVEQAAWSEPENGSGAYDFGAVNYCYITLEPLASHVPEPSIADYALKGETKNIMGHEQVIEAPIDLVFNVLSDLSIRHEWIEGIKDSDRLNSKITRNGATHRCVIKSDESDPFMISHNFQTGKDFIAFTDTNHKAGIDTIFTLRKIGPAITRLEMHYFMKRNIFKELMMALFVKKKHMGVLQRSCKKLNDYCKEIYISGRQHPAQILLHPASAFHSMAA